MPALAADGVETSLVPNPAPHPFNARDLVMMQRHAGAEDSKVHTVDELLPERREVQATEQADAKQDRPELVSTHGTLASARAFAAARLKPADQDRFVQRTAERVAGDLAAGRQPPQVELKGCAIDAGHGELER